MTTTRNRSTVVLVLAALSVLLLAATAAHAGEYWHGFVDGPLVIGDQLYKGGEIEIRTHYRYDAVSIRIDDEPVAVMFYKGDGPRNRDAEPALVLRYGERGYPHLVSIRWQLDGDEGKQTVQRTPLEWDLRVASAIPGLATVPPPASFSPPDEAVASR
jgi:hypothetical protein